MTLQEQIDQAIASKTKLQISGTHVLTEPLRVTDPNNPENTQLVIEGTSASCQIEGWIEGPLVIVDNPRRCVIRDVNVVNHVGDGIWVKSFPTPGHVGSAGNNSFYNVTVQAKGYCWKVEATDGSDFSASSWHDCDGSSGDTGWKFIGSNNLNPHFFNCTGSFLGTMLDFSEGGSGHVIVGGGPSNCVNGILNDQGFCGSVSGWCVEDCQTALKLTSGPGTSYVFGVNEVRGTKYLVDSATNNGNLLVSVLATFDKPQVKTTGTGGFISLSQSAALLKVTKVPGSTLVVQKNNVGFVPH